MITKIKSTYHLASCPVIVEFSDDAIIWIKAKLLALRVGYQLIDLYETGFFSYPLAQTKYILEVKKGLHDYEKQIEPELNRILFEIVELVEKSTLPEKVNKEWWDQWLINVYKDNLLGYYNA